ncbi:MAG TPA: c-type cytochrome, partial [Verrucomicrobiae bacterium]|nr:c-type cytochrome [Verrucomicrobiae bacterium]
KLAAIRTLGKLKPPGGGTVLGDLLLPQTPASIQLASMRALAELNDSDSASTAFAKWTVYSKSVRRQLLGSASRSSAFAAALLDALEKGTIQLTEIDPSTRQALEKSPDAGLKKHAQRLFRGGASVDREQVVHEFQPATQLAGDRAKGAAIFARACLQCHAMQGRGNAVGPNLYSVASQPKETLLVNILDPSRQVTPDYVSYTVTTTDDESLTGLITAESAASVTLRRPNVPDATIQRSQIRELKADGKSLMPDGLEQGLTQQDVADLLEFLRQPDDRLLPNDN